MPSLQNPYVKVNRLNRSEKGQVLDKNNKSLFEIPFSLPHEIIATNDIYDQVNSQNLIEASPFRVKPPCPQFTKCGGCSLQHASQSFVTDWKESIVAQVLE